MAAIAVGQRVSYFSRYAMKRHHGEVVEIEAERKHPRARVRVIDRWDRTTHVWVRLASLEQRST